MKKHILWKFYLFLVSALFATILNAESPKMLCYSIQPNAYLNDHAGDIARIYDGYLGDKIVFDERNYPKRGKGMLFNDRYQFEKRVPITIEKGKTRLSVVSINSHGNWLFSLRITDENDLPFGDVQFRLK